MTGGISKWELLILLKIVGDLHRPQVMHFQKIGEAQFRLHALVLLEVLHQERYAQQLMKFSKTDQVNRQKEYA